MKKFVAVLALVSGVASFAQAEENPYVSSRVFGITTYQFALSGDATSDLKKSIVESQEDIIYFVATDGAVRTGRLNHALDLVREMSGDKNSSDLELANAVLANFSN
jgi:uncharacterized protein (TIGR02448 family)